MANDVYLDMPPPPDKRINELHVWIATYPDGSEGIMSTDLPVGGKGIRHMPLMSSDRDTATSIEQLARRVQRTAMHQAGRAVSIRLVTFRCVE